MHYTASEHDIKFDHFPAFCYNELLFLMGQAHAAFRPGGMAVQVLLRQKLCAIVTAFNGVLTDKIPLFV